MFTSTVNKLIKGDSSIVECYQRAMSIWREIWDKPESNSVEGLAILLSNRQEDFERCGGYLEPGTGHAELSLGQEIMVVSGFFQFILPGGGFADDGSWAKAKLLSDAFEQSGCSGPKAEAARMAEYLGLVETER